MSDSHFAIQSEEYLIGAALSGDRTVFTHILDHIEGPQDFYREGHREAWRVIMELYQDGKGIDLPIVTQSLPEDSAASGAMLSECFSSVASTDASTVGTHAMMVRENALKRRIREIGHGAIHDLDNGEDVFDVLDTLQTELLDAQRGEAGTTMNALEGAKAVMESMETSQEESPSVASGLREVDNLTAGWQPGDLVVIAARPSMGKTSLALHMAHHAACNGVGVGFFSVEMASEALYKRIACADAGVDSDKERKKLLSDAEKEQMYKSLSEMSELPMVVDDRSAITPMQVRARAHEWAMQGDLGMIVVDYLQFMRPGVSKGTREQEVAYMSREMKSIARDVDVPVLLLSQLNRGVENRTGDKRPQLSDLRASGAIEQDADVVGFIYRAERYGLDTDEQGRSTRNVAEIIFRKQRNGPIGTARVRFDDRTGAWGNLSERDEPSTAAAEPGGDTAPF